MVSDKHNPPNLSSVLQLRKICNRTLRACVKMIKEMTSEELPRKRKKASMIKVSVNIPPDKSIGDEITFG